MNNNSVFSTIRSAIKRFFSLFSSNHQGLCLRQHISHKNFITLLIT